MPSSDPSVEVTLQSIDGLDDFAERKFVVSPSTTVPIGRSSKNHSKKLMSGPDNAFIDSPVISREHARFSASNAMGIPTVYLIDNGSMHGTLVNSKPLQRHQSHRLHNGDTLQFGTNVVRDQDSFIAKKFRFHSQIAPAISHGFTVPDADDSEEEEVDNDQHIHTSSPRAPTYGSIANPVNLDDFEDIPQEVIDLEDDAAGPEPSSPRARHADVETVEPLPVVPHIHLSNMPPYSETKTSQDPVNQAPQLPLVEDNESDDEQENIYGMEEEQMHDYEPKSDSLASEEEEEEGEDSEVDLDLDSQDGDNVSNLSQAGSMDNLDSENESEDLDNDDAGDADAVPRLKLAQMLNYEHLKSTNDENLAPPTNTLSSPLTIPSAPRTQDIVYSCPVGGFSSTVSPQDIHNHPEVTQNNVFHQPFANTAWDPLPPRPTAPKAFWGPPGPDAHGTFLRGELNHFSPYPGSFSGPSYGHRMGYLGQILNSETIPAPYTMTMGLPIPPVPTPSEVRPLTPPANRRNGVSIPELVEETPQQPPTPTSVDSPKNLKRKAEFLEEEEEEIEVLINEVHQAVEAVEDVVPEVAPVKAEEPQAKRRRITLTAVATNAASFIAGTVFAVGALVLLPEITFS